MKVRNIILLILVAVLCFFLAGCASLLSTQGNSPSKVNSVKNDSSNTRVANKINSVSDKPLETKVTDKIDSVSDGSVKTEEVNNIDYASFYVDSTKEESIEADRKYEAIKESQNKRNCTVFFDSLGYDITEDDALIYAKSSALVGEEYNELRMFEYLGYEIDSDELEIAKKYTKAKDQIRGGNYTEAFLSLKNMNYRDSEEIADDIYRLELLDFEIGDIGPAGGYVFYDKGSYSDGWRYLEAAPEDIGRYHREQNESSYETQTRIGGGKSNTEGIVRVSIMSEYGGAKACADYSYGGYDDWFLPSKDELGLMYTNLKKKGIGNFSDGEYLSSSFSCVDTGDYIDYNSNYEWVQNFENGEQKKKLYWYGYLVRPIRAF